MKFINVLFAVLWFICLVSVLVLALLVWLVIQIYKANKLGGSSEDSVFKGWVARDKDGTLWFYAQKPYRSGDMWISDGSAFQSLNSKLFPSLYWKDKPIKVKLVKDK